jgi:hypothetical protein
MSQAIERTAIDIGAQSAACASLGLSSQGQCGEGCVQTHSKHAAHSSG